MMIMIIGKKIFRVMFTAMMMIKAIVIIALFPSFSDLLQKVGYYHLVTIAHHDRERVLTAKASPFELDPSVSSKMSWWVVILQVSPDHRSRATDG